MRREAFAFATYLLYATQARKHGRPEVAEAFETVAKEECFGHFVEQALDVGLIGMEAENLHLAERFRRLREDERRNRGRFLAVLRDMDPADPAE